MGFKIPKAYKRMMVHVRPFNPETDDIEDTLPSEEAREAFQQKEFKSDKDNAVKRNTERIHKTREHIKNANGKAKEMLEDQLVKLYCDRFQLMRNEYLNACKDGCLLDEGKLAKIPGSPQWLRVRAKDKQKTQNK